MREPVEAAILERTEDLRDLLAHVRTIAVVGLSPDPGRDSHTIAAYLQRNGYRIVPVNPAARSILGEPCHPSLSAIPAEVRRAVDLVAVFRRPEAVVQILEEAASLGLRRVWLQIGVSSPAAVEAAGKLGLTMVANKCLRVVHSLVMRQTEATREVQSDATPRSVEAQRRPLDAEEGG